jgi:tetratricopeptide (TPR) repeat protein
MSGFRLVPSPDLDVGRYKRLALRSGDVWQGGLVRLPAWVPSPGVGAPYRMRGALWRSTRTGLAWVVPEMEPGSADVALAVRALVEFAQKHERELLGRPGRIEVTNATFANDLRAALDDPHTTIAVVDDLPEVRDALRGFGEADPDDPDVDPGDGVSSVALLDDPRVTLDLLRNFAAAAADFYRAAPWEALDVNDLIAVASDRLPAALTHCAVHGAVPHERGLLVFERANDFDRYHRAVDEDADALPPVRTGAFGSIDELSFGDADAWTDHDLAVASPDAYPRPRSSSDGSEEAAPSAEDLAALTLLLRALADLNEDEIDRGRWTRTISSPGGEDVVLQLSLPRLLDDIAREQASASSTPEAADALAARARSARGRQRARLARQALALSQDCSDAWSVLADRARDLERAIDLYRKAMAAGERRIGPERFANDAGRFWTVAETRPYMRARLGLAECLDASGNFGEALTHYEALLRLNAADDQGVRQSYLLCLLEAGRVSDALALIDRFKSDDGAEWLFASALVSFRCEGASDVARGRLDRAIRSNPHVAPLLIGTRDIPPVPDVYRQGSVEEAAACAEWLLEVWHETPGAIEWLIARARHSKRATS